MKYCIKCRGKNSEEEIYCDWCGALLPPEKQVNLFSFLKNRFHIFTIIGIFGAVLFYIANFLINNPDNPLFNIPLVGLSLKLILQIGLLIGFFIIFLLLAMLLFELGKIKRKVWPLKFLMVLIFYFLLFAVFLFLIRVICYFNTWIKERFTELKMAKIACPKCNSKKLYNLQSGKRRCARCRYEFIPHKLPLTFSRDEWKEILHLFLMEQSSNSIAEQTRFEQRRVLRALPRFDLWWPKTFQISSPVLSKWMKPI